MQKYAKHNTFTHNGKSLRRYTSNTLDFVEIKENISSLATLESPKKDEAVLRVKHFYDKALKFSSKNFAFFNRKFSKGIALAAKFTKSSHIKLKEVKLPSFKKLWVAGSYATFSLTALVLALYPMKVSPEIGHKYSIYASTPLQFGSTNYKIYSRDARSQKINQVFRQFNCPLEGMGEAFVYEADKNDIPWWLVAAVSFQESSCGKATPEPSGAESYNAWGWAVYGDQVQSFDNWARGIEAVSEYMSDKFFSKGITDTCEIMKTYTPPSKGSWCEGVKYFGDLIQGYKTPE